MLEHNCTIISGYNIIRSKATKESAACTAWGLGADSGTEVRLLDVINVDGTLAE